jgi:type III secretory pathway component EscS
MAKRRLRKRKLVDKKQQRRFALELILHAMLFPMLFLVLSLSHSIVNSYMGKHTKMIQPLYEVLAFCADHWWEFLVALVLVSGISILTSHRMVGPIHRFERALIQKTENPSEPAHCRIRSKDYFQDFARRLEEFLNAPQALAGSADPEGSIQGLGPEPYSEDSEVAT